MGVIRVSVEAGGLPSGRRGAAHRPQKRVPEGFSKPQREQFTVLTALACSFADLEINKNAVDSQLGGGARFAVPRGKPQGIFPLVNSNGDHFVGLVAICLDPVHGPENSVPPPPIKAYSGD